MVVIIGRCSDSLHRQLVRRVAQLLVITTAFGVLLLLGGFVAGVLLLLMRRLRQAAFEITSLLAAAVLGALVLLVKVSEDLIELCLHFLNLNVILVLLRRAVLPFNFTSISRLHGHVLSIFCQQLLFPLLL